MFRKDAIDSKKLKWRGRAILLPGISVWLTALGSSFFIVAFLLFVITGTYTRRVTVSGEITTWPRPVNVFSSVQGYVVKQYVEEGQKVKKGDAIYLIDVSRSASSGVVSDSHLQDIESQIARVDSIMQKLKESKNITLSTLEKQRAQYKKSFASSTDILRRAEEGIKIMKNNMLNYKNYQLKGLINKDQLTNQVALYYQHQNNLLNLTGQNEQNALQITSLENQIHIQAAEFDNRIFQMELQRYDLQKEKINADIEGKVIVRALSDGKIDSLSVTNGQMVSAGDSLLKMIPINIEKYYLVLWVPNDAVPYISINDKVNVRYEAFPAEKFGQFSAKVFSISRTPASPQEMSTYRGAPTNTQSSSVPWYRVIVMPEKQAITWGNKSLSLENGMKAKSTLFLEKRGIYQWMLSPFYDMRYSTTGPVNE